MYGGCLLCPLYPLLVTPDAFIEKIWGAEICIKFEREEFSITGEYCSKTDSKVEDLGRGTVVCVACRRRDLESKRLSTRRSKTQLPCFRNRCDKHHYHCFSFSLVWKSSCFYTCFCIACYCFSCKNLLNLVLRCCIDMKYPRYGDSAFGSEFCKGVY